MVAHHISRFGILTLFAGITFAGTSRSLHSQSAQTQPVPPQPAMPQTALPQPATDSIAMTGRLSVVIADSIAAPDQGMLQHLLRLTELDSALAMSALPRLRIEATRDLARATVINHRAMGDSLRSAAWRHDGLGAHRTRYASHLENEARHRLRLAHADVDLSYVLNAITLQRQTLQYIDNELMSGLQAASARAHVTAARQQASVRLAYAEQLRDELMGTRTVGR